MSEHSEHSYDDEEQLEGWESLVTDDGTPYYHNHTTNQTVWETPSDFEPLPITKTPPLQEVNPLPPQSSPKQTESWVEYWDDANHAFYYINEASTSNTSERSTTWEEPYSFEAAVLPVNWMKVKDERGNSYFYNEVSEETVWDFPTDMVKIKNKEEEKASLFILPTTPSPSPPSPTKIAIPTIDQAKVVVDNQDNLFESLALQSRLISSSKSSKSTKSKIESERKPSPSTKKEKSSGDVTTSTPASSGNTTTPLSSLPTPQPQPQPENTADALLASRLEISTHHVSNIRALQSTMDQYVLFLKGELDEPPVFHIKPLASDGVNDGDRSTIRRNNNNKSKPLLYPRHLSDLEQELSKSLRKAQREVAELRRSSNTTTTLSNPNTLPDSASASAVSKKKKNLNLDVGSKDTSGWIKAIQELVSKKQDDVGTLLTKGKAANDLYSEVDQMTVTALTTTARQNDTKSSSTANNNNNIITDKLKQESLALKTKLEMITYDLAEFDELSLETQMLREAQFRSEKRAVAEQREMEELRLSKIDLNKQLVEAEAQFSKDVGRIYAESLDSQKSNTNSAIELERYQEELDELNENYEKSKHENKHLHERLSSCMLDLSRQRVSYEELAERAIVTSRGSEKLAEMNETQKGRLKELEPAFNELMLNKVKTQYLQQQVQILNGEVALLTENKTKLSTERNNFRKKLKATEVELDNVRGEWEMLQESGVGSESDRLETVTLKIKVSELEDQLLEFETVNGELKQSRLTVTTQRQTIEKLNATLDDANVEMWMGKVAYLEGVVAAMESEEAEEMGSRIYYGAGADGVNLSNSLNISSMSNFKTPSKRDDNNNNAEAIQSASAKESARTSNINKELKERVKEIEAERLSLERTLVNSDKDKKSLQAQLNAMEVEVYKAEENAKRAERARKTLAEAARNAVIGGNGGEEGGEGLIRLAEISAA